MAGDDAQHRHVPLPGFARFDVGPVQPQGLHASCGQSLLRAARPGFDGTGDQAHLVPPPQTAVSPVRDVVRLHRRAGQVRRHGTSARTPRGVDPLVRRRLGPSGARQALLRRRALPQLGGRQAPEEVADRLPLGQGRPRLGLRHRGRLVHQGRRPLLVRPPATPTAVTTVSRISRARSSRCATTRRTASSTGSTCAC